MFLPEIREVVLADVRGRLVAAGRRSHHAALFSTTCRERMRDDDALWTEVREQCHLVGGCAAGGSTRGVVAPAASCYKPAANVSKYDLANLW